MAKRKARSRRRSSVAAQLTMLRRELVEIRKIVNANAAAIQAFDTVAMTNIRRCAELQADIDRIKKALAVA